MRLLPGVSKIKLQDNYDNNKPRYRMSSNWELLSFQLFDGSKEKCCNSLHAPRKEIWFESLMKEFIATINSEGQVTIPAEIRKYLGITTNEKIAFVIDDEGVVRLGVPCYPTIASLRGAAGRRDKPLSWREMQKIAQEDRFDAKHESK